MTKIARSTRNMGSRKPVDIVGLVKHAQVARILAMNKVTPLQFYIVARSCHELLPPCTIGILTRELKMVHAAISQQVRRLAARGLLTVGSQSADGIPVNPTTPGWGFYFMLLAEMERPIHEPSLPPKGHKTRWHRPRIKDRPKAGAAMKKIKIVALSKKVGLSIWERCGLAFLPKFQRLGDGEGKSSVQVSTPPCLPEIIPPGQVPWPE